MDYPIRPKYHPKCLYSGCRGRFHTDTQGRPTEEEEAM